MNPETQYKDAEGYQGSGFSGQGLSFRQICLNQFSRITTKASNEWHGGYVTYRMVDTSAGPREMEVWVPNSREEYINSVNNLYDLLFPYFDEQMNEECKKFFDDFEKKKEELKEDVKKKEITDAYYQNAKVEYYRNLFRSLSCLLKRLGYLESGSVEDS